ncbi:unnamed protein product, partial [Prunus brigantina]
LQARTTLCVFLGYLMGYKGILCFNMSTAKLLVSRDVVHDEGLFPFKQGVLVLGSSSSSVASTSSAPISVVLPILSHADIPPPLSDTPATPPVSIASVLDSSSASDISPTHHHSMQTRSKSGVTKRKDFADYECYHTSFLAMPELDEPSSYRVARYSPEWIIAMQEEISALNTRGTWTPVPPPPGVNIVGSKWIYKVKRNSDGSVSRYKARLVAQGFSQTRGFDYSKTFSPVVRHTTVRLILSLAAMHGWQLRQLDFVFEMKDMGRLTYFLGLRISYPSTGSIFVSRQKYAKELLAKAGMTTCKACSTPCKPHTQVLRSKYGITFSPGDMHLHAYSDADRAGDPSTRRSTTGFVVFIGSNPVSWQSKKQGSVSRSSTEAEYRALANTAADIAWVRQVLADLHEYLPEPPLLFCDNLSALALSSNPVQHSRIKHLDIDFHFIRERVQRRDIMVQYIPTEEQIADVFTKGLYGPVFVTHCINLRLGIPAEIEGGCLPK